MINKALFTSNTPEWATPQDFYDKLHKEFNFTLDPCATKENAKCKRYFTQSDDGLSKSWDKQAVFCNPPYGRVIKDWVKKASEARGGGSGFIDTLSDGYSILSRLYLSEKRGRNSFLERSIEIWRWYGFSAIPKYGSNF